MRHAVRDQRKRTPWTEPRRARQPRRPPDNEAADRLRGRLRSIRSGVDQAATLIVLDCPADPVTQG